jgi:hypothetical protein
MNARTILPVLMMASAVSGVLVAQQRGDDDWCREERWGNDRAGVCEVREYTVAATSGVLTVQGANGGISVEGQARGDVRILAKIVATAETQARARELANEIRLNPTLEQVEAEGPRGLERREGWSVSYRVSAPRGVNLALRTSNGGITVRDMDSKVEFRTTNGGVKLIGLSGNVRGLTTNGGVRVTRK